MRVDELISGLDARLLDPQGAHLRVCDLTEDSRTVLPGSLYIARRGANADGRAFVPAALAAGAVAILTDDPALSLPALPHGPRAAAGTAARILTSDILLTSAHLAERFYGSPSSRLTVVGVTGTNGKTTTTFLIHQMLNALGIRAGLMGTVAIDDGTEVAPAAMTTPPSLEISRTLARMLEAGCRAAVLEVSSHSLHQKRVAAIAFDVAVFTNLTGDHLDYHRTMEDYGAAKAILFESLAADAAAIVNADDSAHQRIVRGCRARVLRCSLGPNPAAECLGRVVDGSAWATGVTLTGPWGQATLTLPLIGSHNAMNALQAGAAVHAAVARTPRPAIGPAGQALHPRHAPPASLDAPTLASLLSHVAAPPGRLECLTQPSGPFTVYVDYAHTDDALRTVLTVLRGALSNRQTMPPSAPAGAGGGPGGLLVVFGCGGDRDKTKRPRMGEVAARLADRVIITSDNPRTERPHAIIDDILEGVASDRRAAVTVEADRELAIHAAIDGAAPGDIVLIAGKGHEDYQILPDPTAPGGTVRRDIDDRVIARRALLARGIAPLPASPPRGTPHAPGIFTHAGSPAPSHQP